MFNNLLVSLTNHLKLYIIRKLLYIQKNSPRTALSYPRAGVFEKWALILFRGKMRILE